MCLTLLALGQAMSFTLRKICIDLRARTSAIGAHRANIFGFLSIRQSVLAVSNDGPPLATLNWLFSRQSCVHFDHDGDFGRATGSRRQRHEQYGGKCAGSKPGQRDDCVIRAPAPAVSNDATAKAVVWPISSAAVVG